MPPAPEGQNNGDHDQNLLAVGLLAMIVQTIQGLDVTGEKKLQAIRELIEPSKPQSRERQSVPQSVLMLLWIAVVAGSLVLLVLGAVETAGFLQHYHAYAWIAGGGLILSLLLCRKWLAFSVFSDDARARAQMVTVFFAVVAGAFALLTFLSGLTAQKRSEFADLIKHLGEPHMRTAAAPLLADLYLYNPWYAFPRRPFRNQVVGVVEGFFKDRYDEMAPFHKAKDVRTIADNSDPCSSKPCPEQCPKYSFYVALSIVTYQMSQYRLYEILALRIRAERS